MITTTDRVDRSADVLVVGGGPAGLSAALTLAQAFRDVIVLDDDEPANRAAPTMRGHLTRDGIDPHTYRAVARTEVTEAGALLMQGRVRSVRPASNGRTVFETAVAGGPTLSSRRIVLATGVTYSLPDLPGLRELWGTLIHNCPYCHSWGSRRAPRVLVLGSTPSTVRLAALLTQWADDVILVADPGTAAPVEIRAVDDSVAAVRRTSRNTIEASLSSGETIDADVCFIDPPATPRLEILHSMWPSTEIPRLDPTGRSPVDGLWITGTAASTHQKIVMAAAHGATAGQAINASLTAEDLGGDTSTTTHRDRPTRLENIR